MINNSSNKIKNESIDSLEQHFKRNELRLNRVAARLDSNLHNQTKKFDIPYNQQCAIDDIDKIPAKLEELRNRFEMIKNKSEEFLNENQSKLEKLEERSEKFPKFMS